MSTEVGRREAHKIATRHAIQAAADVLFSERGYEHTTVRDIADAAGVTERTFFRYFSVKEELLVADIDEWLLVLGEQIRRRPTVEAPLDAVEHAFFVVAEQLRDERPNMSWLFQDGPPGPRLEKSAPGLLLRFEQEIADALQDRHEGQVGAIGPDEQYACQVLARCAVAALRSAGLRHWQLGREPGATLVGEIDLIKQAFAILRHG